MRLINEERTSCTRPGTVILPLTHGVWKFSLPPGNRSQTPSQLPLLPPPDRQECRELAQDDWLPPFHETCSGPGEVTVSSITCSIADPCVTACRGLRESGPGILSSFLRPLPPASSWPLDLGCIPRPSFPLPPLYHDLFGCLLWFLICDL